MLQWMIKTGSDACLPLLAREGMRSVTLVCTIQRNTQAHSLAGGRPYSGTQMNTNLLSETDKRVKQFHRFT